MNFINEVHSENEAVPPSVVSASSLYYPLASSGSISRSLIDALLTAEAITQVSIRRTFVAL
jgi:hypothetical protein